MKTKRLVSFFIAIALVAPALAGKPHKGGGKPRPQQQQAPPQPAGPQPPSARLSQFTAAHLDHILASLDQQIQLPRTELAQLRESFVDQWTKAPQTDKAAYQAAVAVCDALSSAMAERDKAIADSQPSNIVHGVQETHDATVSIPRGRGRGRAANAAVRQEKYENQKNQNQAAQKDAFLNSNVRKQWLDRAAILRQQIQQLSSRQRDAERAAAQATSTSTSTPSSAPTVTPPP
jgi:hypothetical protein